MNSQKSPRHIEPTLRESVAKIDKLSSLYFLNELVGIIGEKGAGLEKMGVKQKSENVKCSKLYFLAKILADLLYILMLIDPRDIYKMAS